MQVLKKSLIYGIVLSFLYLLGFLSILYLGNDNIYEELSEDLINKITGIEIDISEGEENG